MPKKIIMNKDTANKMSQSRISEMRHQVANRYDIGAPRGGQARDIKVVHPSPKPKIIKGPNK